MESNISVSLIRCYARRNDGSIASYVTRVATQSECLNNESENMISYGWVLIATQCVGPLSKNFSNAALMPQKENGKIQFRYFDHKTKRYLRFVCSEEEFFKRLLQHIPDKGFRLIRYYGFLANRVRSEYLPTVYNQLNQPERNALAIAQNPESKRLLLRVMLVTKRITTLKYLGTDNKW